MLGLNSGCKGVNDDRHGRNREGRRSFVQSFVSPALGWLVGEEGHYGELGSSPLVQTVTMEHSIPPTGSGPVLAW